MESGVRNSHGEVTRWWKPGGFPLISSHCAQLCAGRSEEDTSHDYGHQTLAMEGHWKLQERTKEDKVKLMLGKGRIQQRKKKSSIQKTIRIILLWKWIYIIYEAPTLFSPIKQQT